MKSNGFGEDGGKRRGKRRRKGRGGFSNSSGGSVLSPPAPPASSASAPEPGEELLETAVIENLPRPWTGENDALPEAIDMDVAVEFADELFEPESPPQSHADGEPTTEDDLLLLEELTRPDSLPSEDSQPSDDAPVSEAPHSVPETVEAAIDDPAPAEPPLTQVVAETPPSVDAVEPAEVHLSADEPAAAAIGETAAEQVVALQAELIEKDQLLEALTAQLEEAANRLDRLHRAGADRVPRRGGASISAEGLERQSELVEQVARLADAWDEWRAADQMADLCRKIDDLSSLVAQNARSSAPRDTTTPRLSESWTGEFNLPPAAPADKAMPKWEQMKAQLLGDSAIIDQPWESLAQPEFTHNVSPTGSQVELDLGVVVEPLGAPPAAVNVDSADLETLQRAVVERDEFISQLLRRLRSTSACRREPIDWVAINNAPDDLRERLQELEARFQELLRIEECDMSLERARLARERARLEQLRRELEKNGHKGSAGPTSSDNDDSRRERRWLRVFSFGGKRDDDLD